MAFDSNANYLLPASHFLRQVYVYDRQAGRTVHVSKANDGSEGSNDSRRPCLSGDGKLVVFGSLATNLVPNDTNGCRDIFLHDRRTGQTTRVSVASDGTQANYESENADISDDGRYVVFRSLATNLVPGDTNDMRDVFMRDLSTGAIWRLSATATAEANYSSDDPSITPDGHFVAFDSGADNLVPGDINGLSTYDVFVCDAWTGALALASVASDGTQGNGNSYYPSISYTGRYVAFESDASNLVPGDTNGEEDIFVRDRATGQTERVSVSSAGGQGNGDVEGCCISGKGRYVAFASSASNLVPGDTNGRADIFLHDREAGTTIMVSTAPDGTPEFGWNAAISRDGRYVGFESDSDDIVPGDTDSVRDVFVTDTQAVLMPDMWVKARGNWVGDGIYNTTGREQTVGRTVSEGSTAIYRLRVQNDGGTAGQLAVKGTGGGTYWQVQYFDRPAGGTDITAQVTGAGFQTPTIASGGSVVGRLEVTPLAGAGAGSRYTVRVSGTPAGSSRPKDVVRANTNVRGATAPQIASLAAVPTPTGAEVVFTLSGAASVSARVLNIAGRPVAAICSAKECEAGTNRLLWSAVSSAGLAVPSGRYLVEVSARTDDGAESRALTQVSIRR